MLTLLMKFLVPVLFIAPQFHSTHREVPVKIFITTMDFSVHCWTLFIAKILISSQFFFHTFICKARTLNTQNLHIRNWTGILQESTLKKINKQKITVLKFLTRERRTQYVILELDFGECERCHSCRTNVRPTLYISRRLISLNRPFIFRKRVEKLKIRLRHRGPIWQVRGHASNQIFPGTGPPTFQGN